MTLCKKKIAWQPIFIFRSDNVRKEKRHLTFDCWICSEKTVQRVAAKICYLRRDVFVNGTSLFACIITSNFYSKNVTLLYTEVCFYEISLYFWIFNFQGFHVSNIKSRWKRIDITASVSGNFWSVYFSSFSLVSFNFLSVPRPCNNFLVYQSFTSNCLLKFRDLWAFDMIWALF